MRATREPGRPGLLARLFCFAPSARVGHAPRSSRAHKQHPNSGTGEAAAGGLAATPPSGAGGGVDALTAYLGNQPLLALPLTPPSTHTSSWQTAPCDPEAGYDADSDHQPDDLESCSSVSGQRRFAPATRRAVRSISSAGSRADARSAGFSEAADSRRASDSGVSGGASTSSGGNKQPVGAADQAANQATLPEAAAGNAAPPFQPVRSLPPPTKSVGLSAASLAVHGASKLPTFSRIPSRDGSVLTLAEDSSSTASAAASSISLAHLLSGSSTGSTSSQRKLRRIGSTQVVVSRPASPGPEAAPAPASKLALPAGAFASPAAAAAAAAAAAGREAVRPAPPMQRRLTDIHSGHFVSLHTLQRQCGDLAEPPADLLSLLARRFMGGCDQDLLAKQLTSESRLPATAAEKEAEAAAGGGEQPTPRSPATPALDACQAPASPHAALDCLPQLPPIRTRMSHGRHTAAKLEQPWSA